MRGLLGRRESAVGVGTLSDDSGNFCQTRPSLSSRDNVQDTPCKVGIRQHRNDDPLTLFDQNAILPGIAVWRQNE